MFKPSHFIDTSSASCLLHRLHQPGLASVAGVAVEFHFILAQCRAALSAVAVLADVGRGEPPNPLVKLRIKQPVPLRPLALKFGYLVGGGHWGFPVVRSLN